MKLVLQRVARASVAVDGATVASIGAGLTVFVGVFPGDGAAQIDWLVDKLLGLRIFPGDGKPMNRSVRDIDGEVLLVSQFTLAADTSRGKRPGFSTAAPPDTARATFDAFVETARAAWPRIATGVFGADMQVHLVNDGPVTFVLER